MNDVQRREHDSIKRIIATSTSATNAPKLTEALVPGFPAELAKLIDVEALISLAGQKQATDTSGAVPDNISSKYIMSKLAVKYSLRGAIKARNAGNHKLAEQLAHRINYIFKAAKGLAVQRATDMCDTLNNNLSICNNVTTADILLINDAITNFKAIESEPTLLIEEKKAEGTDKLILLFKESSGIIENMYDLVYSYYFEDDTALVDEFQLAMQIIKTGVHHTGLNSTCIDANPPVNAISSFLMNVLIKIIEIDRTTKTDINGLGQIVKFKPGTYHVEFSLTSFVTQTLIIQFKRGRMLDLQIEMKRITT